MLYLIFATGLLIGIAVTGTLAHYCPLLFTDPEKYFSKLARKLEKKADKAEESVKAEIKGLLRELITIVNRINLIE